MAGRLMDFLFGRAIRWVGRQLELGRVDVRRQQDVIAKLLDSVGEAIAVAVNVNRGFQSDFKYTTMMGEAEGRILAYRGQLADDELTRRVTVLLNRMRDVTQRSGAFDRAAFAKEADAVTERAREILTR